MSNSLQNKPAQKPTMPPANGEAKPNGGSTVEFKTENIGRWASKQENPFAEQNRKTDAKKKKRQAKVRKSFPVVMSMLTGSLAILLVFCIVMLAMTIANAPKTIKLPEIDGDTAQSIIDYREMLQQMFDQENTDDSGDEVVSVDDINNAINASIRGERDREKQNAVRLAQLSFYVNNDLFSEAVELGGSLDPDSMTLEQRSLFYNAMAYSLHAVGNEEESVRYYGLASAIVGEINRANGME